MKFNQDTVDLFLNQVFASNAIKEACNILLQNSYDKNTIGSELQFGLCSIFETFHLYRNNQLTTIEDLSDASGKLFISSKLYRERMELAMLLLDKEKELVPYLNFGELEQKRDFRKIVMMNYAPMECYVNATLEEREAHNLMIKTNCCVRFLKEILPGMLDTLNGHNDPWCERKELLFVDLCCLAFDNPGFKRSGYYLKLTNLCSKLQIDLNQFFLINIVSVWMAVLMANLDGNDAIKILVAGSYAKKHAFAFGTNTSVLKSQLVKVYCCAHPTVYYCYAVKTYQPARLDQENEAICGYYLEEERIIDIVRQYGFKNRLFSPEALKKMKSIMETNLAKATAEWHRILMAIAANTANEKERKSYDRFIAGCVKGGLTSGETRAAKKEKIMAGKETYEEKESRKRFLAKRVKSGLAAAAAKGHEATVFYTPDMIALRVDMNVDWRMEQEKENAVMVRVNALKHLDVLEQSVLKNWFIGRKNLGELENKWDNNFKLLIEYKREHGHFYVKTKHNKQLCRWVYRQRSALQRDTEKKAILGYIGFFSPKWG